MRKKAVVAGNICLDITPGFNGQKAGKIQDVLKPGSLVNVGGADIHTGGAAANTGLAMKILGADVTIVAKTGDDEFGGMIRSITDRYDASSGLIRSSGDSTSYSVVLAVPGIDRIFLHNTGANDSLGADDIPDEVLADAALMHFGYPPLMKRMYENGGEELVKLMQKAKAAGAATSLDMAMVDPGTEAGRLDWADILSCTMPYVDIFVPSVEEIMFMLDRGEYDRLRAENPDKDLTEVIDIEEHVRPLAGKCMDMGAKIVLIKCGAPGMYYQTAGADELATISPRLGMDITAWEDRQGFERSFSPSKIVSGTGAGDTSIAAFLTSMLSGKSVEECVKYAAATGACCVEACDALSGLMSFEEIDDRISSGWNRN